MQQALELGYIKNNPTNACKLPKVVTPEIQPLDDDGIRAFIAASKGNKYETLFLVTLFTGMREGEVLGLTWHCVDFARGMIIVSKQLQKERHGTGKYHLVPTKNGKTRYLTLPPSILELLKEQKKLQATWKSYVGEAWTESDLVFTNELGHNLSAQTVYLHFKKIAVEIGYPDLRFHDLRHSYAVASLRNGDDIKTLQENLGHHTAAFTLQTYAHATAQMKTESANRMEKFIQNIGA